MIDKIPSYFRQPQINDLYMTKPSSIFSSFFFSFYGHSNSDCQTM